MGVARGEFFKGDGLSFTGLLRLVKTFPSPGRQLGPAQCGGKAGSALQGLSALLRLKNTKLDC